MANSAIVPPKTPLIDPRTGLMAREWYLFFLTVSNLTTSNANTLSIDDLAVSPSINAYDEAAGLLQQAMVGPAIENNVSAYDPTQYCAPSTSQFLAGNQSITLTGDVTGSGTTSIPTTLATVVSAGTNTKITYNAKGLVTAGSQAAASDLSNGTTGSGSIVLATSPTLTAPDIGAATATSLTMNGYSAGTWTTPSYSSGNFTSSSGTWTVNSGSVGTYAYTIINKTMVINFYLLSTDVSGTPTTLSIAIPASKTAAKNAYATGRYLDNNTTWGVSTVSVSASGSVVNINRLTPTAGAAFSDTGGAFDTYVYGSITFEIN